MKNPQRLQEAPPELTEELIASLKQQFPRLFKKELLGITYLFRPISRREYTDLIKFADDNREGLKLNDLDDKTFDLCVVYPPISSQEKIVLPAGIVPSLAKAIQEKSGFEVSDLFGAVKNPTEVEMIAEIEPMPDPDESVIMQSQATCSYKVVKVTCGPFKFLIRGLNRLEWNQMTGAASAGFSDTDMMICKRATRWPQEIEWESLPAGVVSVVSRAVVDISGFDITSEVEEL